MADGTALAQDSLPAFAFTAEVEALTAPIWARIKDKVTPIEWRFQAPLIAEINRLKAEKNAVVLAHNYMTPEIFHGVGDYVGDSLGLAREAQRADAQVIVQAGVHFMAETSKILCPDKTVLIPDLQAGCSLASSITGADVRLIKQRYPGLPVVTYVNTTAEVKAETDVCCTSANAVQVVEYVAKRKPARVVLITECSMADNVACEAPGTEFLRPCNLCPHMKRITLQNIYESLRDGRFEVSVDPAVAERARAAVQRMIDLPPPERPTRYALVRARHHVD